MLRSVDGGGGGGAFHEEWYITMFYNWGGGSKNMSQAKVQVQHLVDFNTATYQELLNCNH